MDEPVFKALADPTRRAILDLLYAEDGRSLSDLQRHFDITRFGVMKHVRVLEEANLVTTRKVGRARLHYLNPVPIREIHDRWIGKFAARASDALLALRSSVEKGAHVESDSKPQHVYVAYIKGAPERVWDALTQSEHTLKYYFGATVESDWTVGSPYTYSIDGAEAITGTVLEADRPSRLSLTFDARWDEDVAADPPSRVTWEIDSVGDELTKVSVVHVFDAETATYERVGGGMPLILSGLKTVVETGQPLGLPEVAMA